MTAEYADREVSISRAMYGSALEVAGFVMVAGSLGVWLSWWAALAVVGLGVLALGVLLDREVAP